MHVSTDISKQSCEVGSYFSTGAAAARTEPRKCVLLLRWVVPSVVRSTVYLSRSLIHPVTARIRVHARGIKTLPIIAVTIDILCRYRHQSPDDRDATVTPGIAAYRRPGHEATTGN